MPGIGNILAVTVMLEVGDIVVLPKWEILPPIAAVYRRSACQTAKAKVMATAKMVIGILAGHSSKQPI